MITIRQACMPVALIALAALSACGGGGGGGNEGAPSGTSGAAEPLAITADNYEQVVSNAGSSVMDASGTARATSAVGVATQSTNWMAAVQTALHNLPGHLSGGSLLVGVESAHNCSVSGTASIVFNDTNGNSLADAGETISIQYKDCVEASDEAALNGALNAKVTKVEGSSHDVTGFEATLSSFKASKGGTSITVDGRLSQMELPGLTTTTAPDLRLVVNAGGSTQTEVWKNFLNIEDTSVSGSTKFTFKGELTSSEFGNKTVVVDTPVPLTFVGEAPVPNAGKLTVAGSNKSVATITVQGEVQPVIITVDTNGDGTPEKSKQVQWSDIAASDLN